MKYFRFQDLDIWKRSSNISILLFKIAEEIVQPILDELVEISKMITGFSKSLN